MIKICTIGTDFSSVKNLEYNVLQCSIKKEKKKKKEEMK